MTYDQVYCVWNEINGKLVATFTRFDLAFKYVIGDSRKLSITITNEG